MSGTPMADAAISSSRTAIQARPIFESRRRRFTKIVSRVMIRIVQNHGLSSLGSDV